MHVHGTHSSNQELFFDTKKDSETGKTMITVPLAKQSKFGPSGFAKPQKQYKMVQLNDKELSKVMSDTTKQELSQLSRI